MAALTVLALHVFFLQKSHIHKSVAARKKMRQGFQTMFTRKNQTAKKLNQKRTKPEKSAIFALKLRFSAKINEKTTT